MKRKIWPGILILTVLALGARPPAAWSGTLYVQAVKTAIQAQPSLSSERLAEVRKGDRLEELEAAGGWYRVRSGSVTGWISRLSASPNPVLDTLAPSVKEGAEVTDARRRASSFTTAAAARGLAEDRARRSQKFQVDYDAVEEMEAVRIDPEEALRFVDERGNP